MHGVFSEFALLLMMGAAAGEMMVVARDDVAGVALRQTGGRTVLYAMRAVESLTAILHPKESRS